MLAQRELDMDELDRIIESSIYKVTRLYLGEQAEEAPPEQPPAAPEPEAEEQGDQVPQPTTGMGMDQTGQADPMGAQGMPGMGYQEPPSPEIEELDVDEVAPNPQMVNPPPPDEHYD